MKQTIFETALNKAIDKYSGPDIDLKWTYSLRDLAYIIRGTWRSSRGNKYSVEMHVSYMDIEHAFDPGIPAYAVIEEISKKLNKEREKMQTTINYDGTSITSTPVTVKLSDRTVPEYMISTGSTWNYTANTILPKDTPLDLIKKAFGVKFVEKPEWKKLDDKIKRVVFNPPATVILWKDKTKTVVKCGPNEIYDPEKGFAMALVKKQLGNKGNYNELFKKWLKENRNGSDEGSDD